MYHPLEGGEERSEVADQPAALAAGEFGDVGVLLLGQHRRAGGVGVVESGEPELLRRPQHPFLADAAEPTNQPTNQTNKQNHEIYHLL